MKQKRRHSSFWHFLIGWKRSRSLGDGLSGLPALFIGIAAILGFSQWRSTPSSLPEQYLQAARLAASEQRWNAAELYYEKVLQREPNQATAVYELAKIASLQHETARRDSLLMRLLEIPDHRNHLWVADLLAESTTHPNPIKQALEHVEIAETDQLDADKVRLKLAVRSYHQANYEQALDILERLNATNAASILVQAQSHHQLGQSALARAAARKLLNVSQEFSPFSRRLYQAQAHVVLGDFPKAIALLERQDPHRNGESVRSYLTETYTQWFHRLDHTRTGTRLALLERGLSLDPANPELLQAFLTVTAQASQEHFIKQAFADLRAPLMTHLALGIRALQGDDEAQATFHLALATQSNPKALAILKACTQLPEAKDHDLTPSMLASVGISLDSDNP